MKNDHDVIFASIMIQNTSSRCQNSNKFICKNHTKIHLFQVYRTLERDKVDVVQNAFLYVISCQN